MVDNESLYIGFLFVVFAALFSGVESAIRIYWDRKIRHAELEDIQDSRFLRILQRHPERLFFGMKFGQYLSLIGAAAVLLSAGERASVEWYYIALGLGTLAVVACVEVLPGAIGQRHAELLYRLTAPAQLVWYYCLLPVLISMEVLHHWASKLRSKAEVPEGTEEQIMGMVEVGETTGELKTEEREMIHNILEMDDTEVKEIMTPRVDMFCLNWDQKLSSVIDEIIQEGFSRIPVYMDLVDNIQGIIYSKDLLRYISQPESHALLKDLMKPALFVTENKRINALLKQFRENKVHIAMVVDEHGGIEGLITIEDVLEELVGEIYDEKDTPERLIHSVDSHTARVLGKAPLVDVNEALDLSLEEVEEYETISGYILYQLRRIPQQGESFTFEHAYMKILKMRQNRIVEVLITKQASAVTPSES